MDEVMPALRSRDGPVDFIPENSWDRKIDTVPEQCHLPCSDVGQEIWAACAFL